MKRQMIVIMTVFVLMFSASAGASFIPNNIGNIESYLNSSYFNAYHEVYSLDFDGLWNYTAIAHESGNWNITEETTTGPTTFTTQDYSNWGLWNQVDFESDNIYFSDSNGPVNVGLDPFSSPSLFRVFQLDETSTLLDYLNNPLTLSVGTYIIGFNDNGNPAIGDSDYDDLIIAATPAAPVPEPGTLLLLGSGLAGLALYRRRMNKA